MILRTANRLPSDQDYIATWPNPRHTQTDNLAQAALDAVAHHGIADPAADRKSKTAVRQIIGECAYHKHIVCNRAPTLANLTKSPVFPHAVTTLHALLLILKFVLPFSPAWWPVAPPQLNQLAQLDRLADGQLHGETLTALAAAALQYIATTGRRHARTESMGLEPLAYFRLPGAFRSHDCLIPYMLCINCASIAMHPTKMQIRAILKAIVYRLPTWSVKSFILLRHPTFV